ncbi:MAG: DUF2946 family protein [Planctomycetes bacterium]|nr:DUF2946 family protein [Planctomycetota bacterium]
MSRLRRTTSLLSLLGYLAATMLALCCHRHAPPIESCKGSGSLVEPGHGRHVCSHHHHACDGSAGEHGHSHGDSPCRHDGDDGDSCAVCRFLALKTLPAALPLPVSAGEALGRVTLGPIEPPAVGGERLPDARAPPVC